MNRNECKAFLDVAGCIEQDASNKMHRLAALNIAQWFPPGVTRQTPSRSQQRHQFRDKGEHSTTNREESALVQRSSDD